MNIHSEKTLKICLYLSFTSICTVISLFLRERWWKTQTLQGFMWKCLHANSQRRDFPSPNCFCWFCHRKGRNDPQRTHSAGDFFLSHISEFSPPPRLQHMTSPMPLCQISAEVHPAFRNQAGNRSLDYFHKGETELFGLAGEQLNRRQSSKWHFTGELPKITFLLSMGNLSQKTEPLKKIGFCV